MPSARLWHIGQVALVWLVVALLFVIARTGLEAGVYEATIEGQRVTIVSGLWSSSFASALTGIAGLVALLIVLWYTVSWVSGTRERRRLATMVGPPHRRPLV